MDRTELLALVSSASSLNQLSSITAGVRAWLVDHPEDEEIGGVLLELARREREQLTR